MQQELPVGGTREEARTRWSGKGAAGRWGITRWTLLLAGCVAPLLASGAAVAETSAAKEAETHYTHRTTLQRDCPIHENYPKPEVPQRAWGKKAGEAVGVRYTYKDYALVLDYGRKDRPNWGFIAKSCLGDPSARSQGDRGTPLPDLQAIGGHGQVKPVPISAPHPATHHGTPIQVGSVGSYRSAPASFVIGNVRAGDAFYLTRPTCGRHNPEQWVLGYAPVTGRWGYIEAMHLPACL
ncbi:hypothetical protein [Planomonospora sp. ID82291]|uniref:hypothetical protein n=1 Tax=Planomonospora sp. ID82291 TaxID=2738136 RepID=UPI0018C4040B|nr:hypothetical protein [Planomonospora sp. ID82291]MBG0814478.1 hypothetical protein [Planomonospora sp. ID82291]